MIIEIDNLTQLKFDGICWMLQRRTINAQPENENFGKLGHWKSKNYYQDVALCLKEFIGVEVGNIEGSYPRDVLDPVIDALNTLETKIDKILKVIK